MAMNEQLFQVLPIYQPIHGYPTNYPESLKTATPETTPWCGREQIGSVERLPTNKATNVRNDGNLGRHSQKRLSCHLDFLETAQPPLKDMTDNNTLFPTTKNNREQNHENLKLVTDSSLESPLLRKIKGTKAKTPDHEPAAIGPAIATKNPSYKTNHKPTKDKSVELYKTEWCRNWQELGVCRYDKKCRYAHSASELRKIERHPRYKTQICRTYHEKGTCPYGVRCTFIHEQQSMANPNIYHHQESTAANRNSSNCEQPSSNIKTAVVAAKTDATTPDDHHHRSAPAPTGLSWMSGSSNLLEQQPNETKELMPLSQMKNVVHSRSASTPNSCWSPTMSSNLWGHRPFHNNEPEPNNITGDLSNRQKRSSSIASTSSFESSIFAGDDNSSPEFDRPTIYRHEHTGYISPTIEDSILAEFSWMSLKPDLLKPHTVAYLTADI
ncbi:hypothetical protein BGW37DRAFT_493919 [Umbelopsis sp. PMI_123]|nr:hypothetical protein BGW37DRAFT_493919 [Umbelopsis sp. PMI_123]